MSVWMISFFFAVGATGFVYAKLARASGNADQKQTLIGAGIAGFMAFIVIFTLFRYVFGFE